MKQSGIKPALVTLAIALLTLVGPPAAAAEPESAPAPEVVTYDASGSAEFRDVVDQAADIWNDSVDNVTLKPAGVDADVVVLADDGWPRAQPTGLGSGTIWMGRRAVREGHDATRIAAHEFGHIYGLPDRRTGECSDLMSGHSAGTSCTNARPNQQEIAEVESNFANNFVLGQRTFVDEVGSTPRERVRD